MFQKKDDSNESCCWIILGLIKSILCFCEGWGCDCLCGFFSTFFCCCKNEENYCKNCGTFFTIIFCCCKSDDEKIKKLRRIDDYLEEHSDAENYLKLIINKEKSKE